MTHDLSAREGPIVHVDHPAPMRCRHRTAGKERVDFDRITTPVRLVHADRTDFELAARFSAIPDPGEGQFVPLFAHEDRLWRIVPRIDSRRFAAALSGAPEAAAAPILQYARGTPLWSRSNTRGDLPGTRRVRTVLHDGSSRAREDLRDYMRNSFRIVGHEVMVSCAVTARHASTRLNPDFRAGIHRHFISPLEAAKSELLFGARPDRIREFWEAEKRFHDAEATGKLSPRVAARAVTYDGCGVGGLDASLSGDEDIGLFVNDAPQIAALGIDVDGLAHPAVAAAAEKLFPWRALGTVGAIRKSEYETATGCLLEFVRAAQAALPASVPLHVRKIARMAEDYVLPLIRSEMAPSDDAEALTGLTM